MIDVNQDVTITLTAGDWGVALQGMAELPYKFSALPIARLEAQLKAAAPQAFDSTAQVPLVNGHIGADA